MARREKRGFGAIAPGERRRGVVTKAPMRRPTPTPARRPLAPPSLTTKARAKVEGKKGFTFPEISISSKRIKVSNLPVGAPLPPTIVFGRTTFTKKGK